MTIKLLLCIAAAFPLLGLGSPAPAAVRVVTYNIEDDTGGYTSPRPGLYSVLEAIGTQSVAGVDQPFDILALEETTSNTATVAPIVSALNSYYAALGSSAVYAGTAYQATQNGSNTSGNGPNALVYNTSTLTLIASIGLGYSSTVLREPVCYEFQPVGGTPAEDFYVYVSHYKSGTSSTDAADRQAEATLIRNNEATLPPGARVLYVGDYNTNAANDLFVNLMASGQGQAFDLLNGTATPKAAVSAPVSSYSESATKIAYRDDDQMVTQNVLNDAAGLEYIAGSYRTFGNNGSTGSGKSVNLTTNTALNNLTGGFAGQQSAILSDLTTASDHLPTVADYQLPLLGDANLDGTVDLRDFLIMDSTYLSGVTDATWRMGDFNGDSLVNYQDYAIAVATLESEAQTGLADQLSELYAATLGPDFTAALAADSAIPEPGTLLLLGFPGLAFFVLRRRSRQV